MARERSPNRDKAKEIYLHAKGNIKLSDIASRLDVSDSQIRKWKSTDKWDAELNGALPLSNSNVTNEKGAKKQQKKKKKEPIEKEVEQIVRSDDLTDNQRLFCIYYLKYFNATKAYQKVYKCDYVAAMTNGSRMLRNDKVRQELEILKLERMNGIYLSIDDIIQKYIDIAFSDSVVLDGVEVKLADRLKALDFLARYHGVLPADVKGKLEIEREKLAIMKRKESPENEEFEDDGFIAALSAQVESVWDDEEES